MKYLAVAAVVLLIPISWIYVRNELALAPHDIDEAVLNDSVTDICIRSNPCAVSIQQLLDNPDSFHNAIVRIAGVVRIEFEGDSVYSTERAYSEFDKNESVWLSLPEYLRPGAPSSGSNTEVIGEFRGARVPGSHYAYGNGWKAEIRVIEFAEAEANKTPH